MTYRANIQLSGKSIYDPIDIGDPDLWVPNAHLEQLLQGLVGLSLSGLPIRTRSKVVKQSVCDCLGYPTPVSFKKTQPRFLGQQLDVYSQKADNLQIWNEEISPERRYALLGVSSSDIVKSVKVVNGLTLAKLDTTGTLTQKFQARLNVDATNSALISSSDTATMLRVVSRDARIAADADPTDEPMWPSILPIDAVYDRLVPLVGAQFEDPGVTQERNRGAGLHRLATERLGYHIHADDGQFPDIRSQLLEIKLQTSPTIDLGLVSPDSTSNLDVARVNDVTIRHCDVRYAVFHGRTDGAIVTVDGLYLTTGEDFFSRFHRFEGRVANRKLQIPLPRGFLVR